LREKIRGKVFIIIGWRFREDILHRYRFRCRGSAIGGFLLPFFLHIGGWVRRCIEVKGVFVSVPHDQIARRQ